MTHHVHELHDGRHVGITGLGDPDATRLVLFCHPSPGAGGFDPDPTVTATAGVRIIAPDRPGYGASDPVVADSASAESWLADLDDYLRSVESTARSVSDVDFGRIGVIGWGTGAVYASALAGRHSELVERLVLVEPTAPTRQRLAESAPAIDARLEQVEQLEQNERYPGAADRMRFMLDDATRHGDDGLRFDRRALEATSWRSLLGKVTAKTLVVTAGSGPDALWYRWLIRSTRRSSDWRGPATTIVEAWPEILDWLRPRESASGERFSDRQGGSPTPQVLPRPR